MNLQPNKHIQEKLKQNRLYCTKARVAVLHIMTEAKMPLTQDQIAERLGRKRLNKVTIYRTLETLLEAGLVHKAFTAARAWHYELADNCTKTQCHPHFTCTRCGDIHCLMGMTLPMAKSPHKGFIIQHQEVRLEGLCPCCA